MTYLYIILATIAYIAIGGFIGGLLVDDDHIMWAVFLWPIVIAFFVTVYIAYWPSKLGAALANWLTILKRRNK